MIAIPIVAAIWLGWIGVMGLVGSQLDKDGTPIKKTCVQMEERPYSLDDK